MKTARYRV